MKAHYRAFGGRLVIEIEGATVKELFAAIGPVAEVLDSDQACGACQSPAIYPRARDAQGFTYYELCCGACGSRLSFGQHKAGDTLWAKRTDEHGRPLENRGWAKYVPADERPRPSGPAEDSDELRSFLRRVRSREQEQDALAELCDRIIAIVGEQGADDIWRAIVKDKPSNEILVRRLWAKIEELKNRVPRVPHSDEDALLKSMTSVSTCIAKLTELKDKMLREGIGEQEYHRIMTKNGLPGGRKDVRDAGGCQKARAAASELARVIQSTLAPPPM